MGIGRKGRGRGGRRHGREAVGGGGGHDWGLDWSGGGGGACVSLAVVLVRKVGGGGGVGAECVGKSGQSRVKTLNTAYGCARRVERGQRVVGAGREVRVEGVG